MQEVGVTQVSQVPSDELSHPLVLQLLVSLSIQVDQLTMAHPQLSLPEFLYLQNEDNNVIPNSKVVIKIKSINICKALAALPKSKHFKVFITKENKIFFNLYYLKKLPCC